MLVLLGTKRLVWADWLPRPRMIRNYVDERLFTYNERETAVKIAYDWTARKDVSQVCLYDQGTHEVFNFATGQWGSGRKAA